MAHYSRLSKVVIDVPPADHGALLPGHDIGLLIQRPGELNDSNARRWD